VIALIIVLVIYVVVKAVGVARGPLPPAGSLALYLVIWPGVRTDPFALRRDADRGAARLIGQGAAVAAAGSLGWWLLAATGDRLPPGLAGWLGVAVLLTTFHCGLSDVVSGGLRRAGYPVRRLFRDPLASRSLREFWSSRWNVAFVEMNQVVFLPWLRRHLGRAAHAAVFVLSGLLHELAISLPVRAGFGLPTAYFLLHAVATHVERRLGVARWPGWAGRLWTWALVVLPLPLLFHRAFRDAVVLPLFGLGGPR
jgi:alginate O-acetyltransferase complex protein AlgI